jgi:hypothetical protein
LDSNVPRIGTFASRPRRFNPTESGLPQPSHGSQILRPIPTLTEFSAGIARVDVGATLTP